eukprot:COSAG01_NODE_1665_length_9571_cov_8.037162_4_plen_779_part_00
MAAAAHGGTHGLDPWLATLRAALAAEPVPDSLEAALAPLAAVPAVDVPRLLRAAHVRLHAPPGSWPPDDWRRTRPDFPDKFALAFHVFTLQNPNLYGPLGAACHAVDRQAGPGGISAQLRAFLPYMQLVEAGMDEAALFWGFFTGKTTRGVKYAFPEPNVATHDPEGHFPPGREVHWFEFNSSSTKFSVMYRPWFCGEAGPRTLFEITSCEGIDIKKFSHLPDEDEVLFGLGAHFRVISSTKRLEPEHLAPNAPKGGFPDEVRLEQLPRDPAQQLRIVSARLREEMAAKARADRERDKAQQARDLAERQCQAHRQEHHAMLLRLLGPRAGAVPEGRPPEPEPEMAPEIQPEMEPEVDMAALERELEEQMMGLRFTVALGCTDDTPLHYFADTDASCISISKEHGQLAEATKKPQGKVVRCRTVQSGQLVAPMKSGRHWAAFELCKVVSQGYCMVMGLYQCPGAPEVNHNNSGTAYWGIGSRDGKKYLVKGAKTAKLAWPGQEPFEEGSIIGLEYDADRGSLRVWKNGTLLGTALDSGVGQGVAAGLCWAVSMGGYAKNAVRVRPWAGPGDPFPRPRGPPKVLGPLKFARTAAGIDISREDGQLAVATAKADYKMALMGPPNGPPMKAATGRHFAAFEISKWDDGGWTPVIGLCGAAEIDADCRHDRNGHSKVCWAVSARNGNLYHGVHQGGKNWGQPKWGHFPTGSVMGLEYDSNVGSLTIWRNGEFLGTAAKTGVGEGTTEGVTWFCTLGRAKGNAVRALPWAGPGDPFPRSRGPPS